MVTGNQKGAQRHAYLLDTNIFLELLLGQERSKECEQLFLRIERGELEAFVLSWALHSIEHLLYTRENKPFLLAHFLRRIQMAAGLDVWPTSIRDELVALTLTKEYRNPSDQGPQTSLDFDDALHYYAAKSGVFFNATIVSFDTDFDRTDITRLEPQDLLTSM
jgi:predicted nucleic acid-binding protein